MTTKRNPMSDAVLRAFLTLGETDLATWRGFATKTRKRPDAIDRLSDLLREDGDEARSLLNRIIEAVRVEPEFSELASSLTVWRDVPSVDVLFRGKSSGHRPTHGPFVRLQKRLDFYRVRTAREILEKWITRVPLGSEQAEIEDFLLKEWKARRFPYTEEERPTRHPARPEAAGEEPEWQSSLPSFAEALYEMQQRRDKADMKGDLRKAGVSTMRLAARIVLSTTGRASGAAAIRRFLDRLEKSVPQK